MKKRIISIALVVVMIVAMIPAILLPTSAINYIDGYVSAEIADGAIKVDGSATPDEAYLNSEMIMAQKLEGSKLAKFYGYTAADSKGLYVWAYLPDTTLDKATGYEVEKDIVDPDTGDVTKGKETVVRGATSGDKFQLYLKMADNKSALFGSIEIDYLNQKSIDYFNKELITTATSIVEGTAWVVEFYIPWTAAGFSEDTTREDVDCSVGFQHCDYKNDASGSAQSYSYDTKFGGSYYLGLYGHHEVSTSSNWKGSHMPRLSFSGIDTVITTDSIVLDGEKDAVYAKSELIDSDTEWGKNSSFRAYAVGTLQGVYIWAEIIDGTLEKKEFETPDKGDKFQVYFKMGPQLTDRDWGYVELDYREYMYSKSDYTDDVLNEGAVKKDPSRYLCKNNNQTSMQNGAVAYDYATTTNENGWTAEIFIPWTGRTKVDSIAEAAKINLSIGLQVNDDDLKEEFSTPSKYNGDEIIRNGISYSGAEVGKAWYSGSADAYAAGHNYLQNVNFTFENDTPDLVNSFANYTTTAPTIDGVRDEIYSVAGKVSANMTDGGAANVNIADAYFAFTDTHVYVFVDMFDANGYSDSDRAVLYWSVSDFSGKFQMNANGTTGSAGYYDGGVNRTDDRNSTVIVDKGSKADTTYAGFTAEFKIALPEAEQAAIKAGKGTYFFAGVEAQTYKPDGSREAYSYSCIGGTSWWSQTITQTHNNMPAVLLDKNISDANFAVTPKIKAATVSLGESIDMNCYVDLPLNATNAQLKVTFNEKEYYLNAKKTATANEYKFVFENIAPQCIGDVIAAELIVDGKVVDAVPAELEYSVLANLKNIKNDDNAALVDALLQYGAAAQVYADYKTDALVADVDAIDVAEFKGAVKTVTAPAAGAKIVAAGVYHANVNKLYVKVEAEDIAAVKALTINGKAADLVAYKDGTYIAYTDAVKATDFGTVYTFVLEYANGDAAQTFTYNVYGYAQSIAANSYNADSVVLAKALYNYGAAAAAYVK